MPIDTAVSPASGRRARLGLALGAALSLFALGGCAGTPSAPPGAPGEMSGGAAAGEGEALDMIGSAALGEVVTLAPGNALGARRVRVVEEYAAASGRLCRRVAAERGASASRVLCRRADGRWTPTRSLAPPAVVQRRGERGGQDDRDTGVLVPALSDVEPLDAATPSRALPASGDATAAVVHDLLRPGESLWSFAARTTGRGEHWRAIAEASGIDDPTRVAGGSRLAIPAALARSGGTVPVAPAAAASVR